MTTRFPNNPMNLIELPGVGPVPRPTDIDASKTGFNKLVSLRIYTFSQDQTIHGDAEDDEVVIVFLQGSLSITVTGAETKAWKINGRESVFAGPAQAIYLPPNYSYRLELHTDTQVAYARARAKGRFPPRLLENKQSSEHDAAITHILRSGDAETLECSEILVTSGNAFKMLQGVQAESLTHYRFHNSKTYAQYSEQGGKDTAIQDGDTIGALGPYAVTLVGDGELYGLSVLARLS